MAKLTLHHLHHETTDVDAAARFYVENFEAVVDERFERDGVQWARLSIAGVMMNVTDRAHIDVELGQYRGLDHFGIHTTDFDETIARLRGNGVHFFIEPVSPNPGVRLAFVSGPDNVKIEVLNIER